MNFLLLLLAVLPAALAAPAPQPIKRASAPTVAIPSPSATIVGITTLVESFNGIPFAQPPTGSLRLKPPQSLTSALGTVYATGIPLACPQMFFEDDSSSIPSAVLGTLLDLPLFQTITNAGEDCREWLSIFHSFLNAVPCLRAQASHFSAPFLLPKHQC